MEKTLYTPTAAETLAIFLREVSAASKKLLMYPQGHPAAQKAAEKPFGQLRELLERGKPLVFAIAESKLIGDGIPLDDKLLHEGLGKFLYESGYSSIALQQNLPYEDFEKFVRYLNVKREQRDLLAFLEAEKINHISVGKLQYQLVGDDERVVSSNVAQNLGFGEAGGDADHTLLDAVRRHPSLLLRLLSKGRGGPALGFGSGGGVGEGSNSPESSGSGGPGYGGTGGVGEGGFSGGGGPHGFGYGGQPGTGDSSGAGLGGYGGHGFSGTGTGGKPGTMPGIGVDPEDQAAVIRSLGELSDDELLVLLSSALKDSLENMKSNDRFARGHALLAARDVLVGFDQPQLIPRLKESVQSLNLVENDYLDMILAAESSPRKVAHFELEHFRVDFLSNITPPDAVKDVIGWLGLIDDEHYTHEFVQNIYADLEQNSFTLSDSQHESLMKMVSLAVVEIDSKLSISLLEEITQRLASPAISLGEFSLLADQLEKYYHKIIEIERYDAAHYLLGLISHKLDQEIVYAEGIEEYASKLLQRLTSTQTAEVLVAKLARNFDAVNKQMAPLLEHFSGLDSILTFTGYLAHQNRGVRILLMRILSSFGDKTIRAFQLVLSDKSLLQRQQGSDDLPLESWYKLRNVIFILGNIPHPDSVAIVRDFLRDTDNRVVMEALIAMEKIGGDEAIDAVGRLVNHANREISIKALHQLAQLGSPCHYPFVEEFFARSVSDRPTTLAIMLKLDRERALTFLAQVLLAETNAHGRIFTRPDETLNETIVRAFIQLRSVIFDDVLRKYVKNQTRTLLSHLRKSNSVKVAEKYLRTIVEPL